LKSAYIIILAFLFVGCSSINMSSKKNTHINSSKSITNAYEFDESSNLFLKNTAIQEDAVISKRALEHRFDLRPVYYYVSTTQRDGSELSEHTANLRARYSITYHVADKLSFRGRVATRLSSNQDSFRFLLDDHTEGSGSYPAGTATLDEFMLRWQVKPGLRLTAGRFQGRFPLEGFIPKGVDRYYGANLSISHTDGIWMEWDVNNTWRLHLIGSHNSTSGSSHTARSPLVFDEATAARISGYANFQHLNTKGNWAQREFSVSLTPKSFQRDGELRNYTAFSTRWMYRFPFSLSGEEYLMGAEVGFIPLAPRPSDFGLQINEDRLLFGSSAMAWQVSAYANHFFERHRVGVLYGQTDPHWLISSSFAPNVTMTEMRYRYTISSRVNYEFRFRFRDEIYLPQGASQTRKIFDFYTRFTISL
jgi:hypothetical protein